MTSLEHECRYNNLGMTKISSMKSLSVSLTKLFISTILFSFTTLSFACSCGGNNLYPEKMWLEKDISDKPFNVFLVKINDIKSDILNGNRRDRAYFDVLKVFRGSSKSTPYIVSFPDGFTTMCHTPFVPKDGIREIGRSLKIGDEFLLFSSDRPFLWSLCSSAFKWNDQLKKIMERLTN